LTTRTQRGLRAIAGLAGAVAIALSAMALSGNAQAVTGQDKVFGPPWSIAGATNGAILWHNNSTNETRFWHMSANEFNGDSTVVDTAGRPALVGPPFSIVGVSDFDRDGGADIVWYNSQTGETQIWFMNGSQVRSRATVVNGQGQPALVGPPFSIVGVSDFDRDGGADIVWYNSQTGETQIWFMNGSQVRSPATVVNGQGQPALVGPPFSIVGVSDFDRDGGADIVWYNSQTGETQIWFMNRNQIRSPATVLDENGQPIFIGPPFSIAAASDLDGNGESDIIWHNSQTNVTQIWFMIGNRILSRADVVDAPPAPPSSSQAPPSSSPALPQVHTYTVKNCDSHPTSAGAVFGASKSVWVNDITANTGFREFAVLQGFPVGQQCGASEFSPQTFVFNTTAGHTFELRVIDYQIAGCSDTPTSCRALNETFTGSATGGNVVRVVTG